MSGRSSIWESAELPFEGAPPCFLPNLALRDRAIQRFCQCFNSGCQGFDGLATCHCVLNICEHCGLWDIQEVVGTSTLSRIKQRPPATALSGGKASAASLTPRRVNLAAEIPRDNSFGFSPMVVSGLVEGLEGSTCLLSPSLERGWSRSGPETSVVCRENNFQLSGSG